jgi:hypothetical protein
MPRHGSTLAGRAAAVFQLSYNENRIENVSLSLNEPPGEKASVIARETC